MRSVMVTVVSGSLLNVSAIIRKKTLRIRRSKDVGNEGTIMSLSASVLTCRSTNKGEELSGLATPTINFCHSIITIIKIIMDLVALTCIIN